MSSNEITFAQAINEAMIYSMEKDPKVLFYALGADDPKRIFGTANSLVEKFGSDRVFDMPTAENAMTGVGIGASLQGYRPVMAHQRLDFFLLAMDQLVNSAAKWHYMFGGQDSTPITIRLIMGRGWGQGPTHSQNLQAWFAHIPGLKVVMPATAADAKSLLVESIFDDNPVVFLEHRWLHNQKGDVAREPEIGLLGKANVIKKGSDVTIVAMSYMVIEALHAARALEKQGISCEVIDMRTVSPIDWKCIENSVTKTGRLLALDTAQQSFSVSSEIVSRVSTTRFSDLKTAPFYMGSPDYPLPTSFGLSEAFYVRAYDVAEKVAEMVQRSDIKLDELKRKNDVPHDVPGDWFTGPF